MNNYSYIGSELELFSEAQNWKAYFSHFIRKYLGNDVLEVGAGNGATTKILCQGKNKRWLCLEPDPLLAERLKFSLKDDYFSRCCEVKIGTLSNLNDVEMFDTIIYIDVLEHIRNDSYEVRLAINHLKNDGFLIILSPAYQWLFTPFDKAIGHYRRYNKTTLSSLMPETLKCVNLIYLDCIGLIASLGNRFILKSKMPNKRQIMFWDKVMIPLSTKVDPILQYSVGKSVLGVWQKQW